jgi:cell division protein FtsI/penicillin-binding protein 2
VSYRQSPLRPRGGGRRRSRGPLILVVVVVLAGAAAAGYYLYPRASKSPVKAGAPGSSASSISPSASHLPPTDALVQQFTQAWTKGNLTTVPYLGGLTGADVQSAYTAIVAPLHAISVAVTATAAQPTADDHVSQSALSVTWQLPGGQVWTYQSSVNVNEVDGSWLLAWKPSVIQPALGAGDVLQYTRLAPTRATILDGAGQPIITARPVVDIGLEAGNVVNVNTTANQMAAILGVNAAALATRIRGSSADEFVDVITLREPDFEKVAAAINAIPGVILRNLTEPLSPSHDFARSLLGTVGPVTKEIVDASNGRYVSGDVGGLGGLEKDFDASLGGTPGFEIDAVHPASPPTVLHVQAAVAGTSLNTTLDQQVEAAADAALGSVTTQPSALVAVRISTGQVIAVANGPAGGGFDTALLGQIVPGSAFKIVTTTALLEQGFNVNTSVPCLPQILVEGKTFHNYEGEQLGSVPFHTDFAKSCNTAFISLSSKVGGSTLPDTAKSLGIGACWSLGTPAFAGSVALPTDQVDLAATSFGQGSTLVSPVSLAVAAATVARGSYIAPQLVLNGTPSSCAPPASAAAPLNPTVVSHLHSLMREVVTSGTGAVLAKAPGGLVMAKTGTAEYGPGATPKTHAWLVGYQGDIAFAVYVQDGQSGGTVAAPVALAFLQNLAASQSASESPKASASHASPKASASH